MHSSKEMPDLSNAKVTDLIRKFALPAIMSSFVGSIYNIADQIFVGQKLGTAGNAATNVAFPLVLLKVTFSMMVGSGGASKFSLHQGAGENQDAGRTIGNSMIVLAASGILLMLFTLIFLLPMMILFGAKGETLELATAYTQITDIGMPFYITGTGCSMYVRADGSPKYVMFGTITGAAINFFRNDVHQIFLDKLNHIFRVDILQKEKIRSAAIVSVKANVRKNSDTGLFFHLQ